MTVLQTDNARVCSRMHVSMLTMANVTSGVYTIYDAGPSTPGRLKGKSTALPYQQQALQALHAAMQRDADGAHRY